MTIMNMSKLWFLMSPFVVIIAAKWHEMSPEELSKVLSEVLLLSFYSFKFLFSGLVLFTIYMCLLVDKYIMVIMTNGGNKGLQMLMGIMLSKKYFLALVRNTFITMVAIFMGVGLLLMFILFTKLVLNIMKGPYLMLLYNFLKRRSKFIWCPTPMVAGVEEPMPSTSKEEPKVEEKLADSQIWWGGPEDEEYDYWGFLIGKPPIPLEPTVIILRHSKGSFKTREVYEQGPLKTIYEASEEEEKLEELYTLSDSELDSISSLDVSLAVSDMSLSDFIDSDSCSISSLDSCSSVSDYCLMDFSEKELNKISSLEVGGGVTMDVPSISLEAVTEYGDDVSPYCLLSVIKIIEAVD